jgi:hypothetical protein
MKHLHQIRLHPGAFPGGKNNGGNTFQTNTLMNKFAIKYTMPYIFGQPCGIF